MFQKQLKVVTTTVDAGLLYRTSTTSSLCNPVLELGSYAKSCLLSYPALGKNYSAADYYRWVRRNTLESVYSLLLSPHQMLLSKFYQPCQVSKHVADNVPHCRYFVNVIYLISLDLLFSLLLLIYDRLPMLGCLRFDLKVN